MEYITLKRDKRIFYIEQDKVLSVIEHPYIEEVPAGRPEIEGISCHEGKLVVYYRLGCAEHDRRCGILLKSGQTDRFDGISGEAAGQEDRDEEELDEIMSGVWIEKNDKTDG